MSNIEKSGIPTVASVTESFEEKFISDLAGQGLGSSMPMSVYSDAIAQPGSDLTVIRIQDFIDGLSKWAP